MSDGVKLAANVFRPDKPGRFPAILTFTPYSKDCYGQHDPFGCSDEEYRRSAEQIQQAVNARVQELLDEDRNW